MNVATIHRFNPAPILAGTRREKAPGGVRATRLQESMYTNAHNAVKGIVRETPRRLLGLRAAAGRRDFVGLLGSSPIARRDGGDVGPQSSIRSLVSGRYSYTGGRIGCSRISQDKVGQTLAGYWSAGCEDSGVTA